MATFIERVLAIGDYSEDGGGIDPVAVQCWLELYSKGDVNAATIKSTFALTTAQGNQLDAILGTLPSTNITLTVLGISVLGPNALLRARWAACVCAVLMLGRIGFSAYDTDAKCVSALGV